MGHQEVIFRLQSESAYEYQTVVAEKEVSKILLD